MATVNERFAAIGAWWERLATRERRLVMALGATALFCALFGVAYVIQSGLARRRNHNGELRQAIDKIQTGRDAFEARKRKEAELYAVIGTEAPNLATYVESAASKVGITVPETNVRNDVPRGKFTEKSIDIKLRGVSLEQLAKFMKAVEEQSQIVVVQRLKVSTYFNQHERLDAEM